MKLSRRERVLILVLIISLLVYAGYKLVPTTSIFNLEALRNEYTQKSDQYNTMSQNILLKNKYEENVNSLKEEINSLNVISLMEQEKIIVFLDKYYADSNIDANILSFTDETIIPNPVTEPSKQREDSTLDDMMKEINGAVSLAEINDSNKESKLTVRQISVTTEFSCSYNNLLDFIDAIQNNKVDMSITNITLVSSEGLLQGSMVINFYDVPKLDDFIEENEEWIWEDVAKFGKTNPFSDGSQTTFTSAGNDYDFYMNLQPESSDLPTVLIGKTNDTERKSYISENINAIENVEFQFKIEDGKYYYRYLTKSASYPQNNVWQEFTPVSKDYINIVINSGSRVTNSDLSGANIAVDNTSGLKVRFDIIDDDKTNPRAYFKDPKSVVVTRR